MDLSESRRGYREKSGCVDVLKFSCSWMYSVRQACSGESIGQVKLSVTLILHLIIIFPKSHYRNVKAFWRKGERLLQDEF